MTSTPRFAVLRSLDGDCAKGANFRQVFVLLETEHRVVNDPCLVVPDREEHRVHFGTSPATNA